MPDDELWHELVLNGVGGKTIEEAQARMTMLEVKKWAAYRAKRGSFNIGRRVERGAALLAALFVNSKTKHGDFDIYDFAPHEDEPPISLEKAKETWN